MKFHARTIFIIALIFSSGAAIRAQSSTGVEQLRSQLNAIQAKEAEMQARARQIDEDLRPENIERSLALTGSTRPEELREQRRRQLEKERDEVRSQLDQLATSRARIEAAITTAETATYRQSSAVETTSPQAQAGTDSTRAVKQTSNEPQTNNRQSVRRRRTRRMKAKRRQ